MMERGATIGERIRAAATSAPDTAVVIHSDTGPVTTSLGQLYEQSMRMATGLSGLGVRPGDVVAVQLPNWLECFVAHAAVWLAGAVLVPITPTYRAREVTFILEQSGATTFICANPTPAGEGLALLDATAQLPGLAHRVVVGESWLGTTAFTNLLRSRGSAAGDVVRSSTDRCLLIYTSGTTSAPKGVTHTHATLLAEIDSGAKLRVHPAGPRLHVFAPGHMAGVLGILRMLIGSDPTVTMDHWNPAVAAGLIAAHGVVASAGAPIHLAALLDSVEADHGFDLSSLREYGTGAASVTPALIRRADGHGITAFRSYGSSEHPTISSGTPGDPLDKRAETDGRVAVGTRVRIVDEDGVDVSPGQPGEILSKGPEQFIGYRDPSLDRDSRLDGWFRTGDIGCLDTDGYLRITDRKKDIIVRGGENISSKEVEDALMDHPAVREAAAVAAPDARYGESVCVFVVLNADQQVNLKQVRDHFRQMGLARHKTPEQLWVVTQLPRTSSGKIQKHLLRAQLSQVANAPARR